ncbi:MAG: DUF5915 domain-containing protein, partial [Chloroflexota bacterium]
TLTPELRAEGDARELTRAIQDLRKQAELALDARIGLWLDGDPGVLAALATYLPGVWSDTLVDRVDQGGVPPDGAAASEVELDGGPVRVAITSSGQA